mgnify:CR=1 FL=1
MEIHVTKERMLHLFIFLNAIFDTAKSDDGITLFSFLGGEMVKLTK